MDELIYDRTSGDVSFAVENQDSAEFLKGAYNYTDLNRVESWCAYLANTLSQYNYAITVTTKTDWTNEDFPTYNEMARIRNNIIAIMRGYAYITNIYNVNSLNMWNFEHANNWEKILHEINRMMLGMENNFIVSGVSRVGQPRLWQQRFRRKNTYYEFHNWEDLTEEKWSDFPQNQTWIGVEFIGETD